MTGWQYINDIWYYFTENAGDKQGAMFCKRWAEVPYNGTVEWYYFDENGTMKTDWLTQDENKFYLYPIADGTRGRMLTGWQKIGGKWYYLKGSGAMAEGWARVSGAWYYLRPGSGAMATGWAKADGAWYYLGPDGAMFTGTHTINGRVYTFDESGVWQR